MKETMTIKPLPLWQSLLLFGLPAVYFLLIADTVIPYFNKTLGYHPALSWFFGGYLVFIPLFCLALILFKLEGYPLGFKAVAERFRIRKLTQEDWKWTAISIAVIGFFTGVILYGSRFLAAKYGVPELSTTPAFMQFDVLQGKEKLYLLLWLPMFFFNIVGEEILWRGYILPRQEARHGSWAWGVNAVLWLGFHACFGIDLMMILLPIILVVPWVAQKTKNTTIGMITHAVLNGPMFVLIALGWM